MYGRVVNKVARHNLCFADADQEPDYEKGKGRIVAYGKVPRLSAIQKSLESVVGPRGAGLCAEGNYYYDSSKCGIGFHGDSERRRVVALRLGATVPLHYQWFKSGQPAGERFEVQLSHGDVYMMSEKAVGTDWKCRSRYTLRHAAGASKFLKI
jgi:alkylated DNA repair dioxygenase AlkB